jgi:hypothetical protein
LDAAIRRGAAWLRKKYPGEKFAYWSQSINEMAVVTARGFTTAWDFARASQFDLNFCQIYRGGRREMAPVADLGDVTGECSEHSCQSESPLLTCFQVRRG